MSVISILIVTSCYLILFGSYSAWLAWSDAKDLSAGKGISPTNVRRRRAMSNLSLVTLDITLAVNLWLGTDGMQNNKFIVFMSGAFAMAAVRDLMGAVACLIGKPSNFAEV